MSQKKLARIVSMFIVGVIVSAVIATSCTLTITEFALTADITPPEGGCVYPPGGSFTLGEKATLTAVPSKGYTFDHWSGSASGNASTVNIIMNSDKSIVAHFKPVFYLVTYVYPSGAGYISPAGGMYSPNAEVTLEALPYGSCAFDHWSGSASGDTPTITIAMDSNKDVTARFNVAEPGPMPDLGTLTVYFIDVGQGDSILMDLGDIEVLIDGGDQSSGVVSYIDDYVDGPLEVMVATHPHVDRIGGLIAVLDAFEVDKIWLNGETSTSQTYSQFMLAVDSERAEVYEARRGDTIEAGNLTFNVLHPANLSGSTNDNSIVLSLSYGQVDFLLTGDAGWEAEDSILKQSTFPVPEVEILKVGHHGSQLASSIPFLMVTKPECAIYTAEEGNSYGHPHEVTITNLCEVGAKIHGTDIHGTILVTTDGGTYNLTPSNDMPAVACPLFLK